MRIQKYKFVENNMKMLRELTLMGYVSPKLLNYYDIYKTFKSIKDKPKMHRYKLVSMQTKNSIMTVRLAVYEMQKYVNS